MPQWLWDTFAWIGILAIGGSVVFVVLAIWWAADEG